MKELLQALAEAKRDFGKVVKDSVNPFHKNKYASLESVIKSVERSLMKHGLEVTHTMGVPPEGFQVKVTTAIWHIETEQFIESELPMISKEDAQGIGSAITYARRYNLVSILNLITEDDDANEASSVVTSEVSTYPSGRTKSFKDQCYETGQKHGLQPGEIDGLSMRLYGASTPQYIKSANRSEFIQEIVKNGKEKKSA